MINTRSRKENTIIILILGALSTITPLTIDMYLPAFPQIAADLNTDLRSVSLSVSTYFVGFAVGQLLYGPLLDRFGRKPPLYAGMGLYLLATAGCIFAPSIQALLVLRFIEALGGCVASVAAIAMVHDFFPSREAARIISLIILVLGVSPLLAPTLGGIIVSIASWQIVFAVLAGIAILILVMMHLYLPEGHKADPTISLRPITILKSFTSIFTTPRFIVFALAGSLSFSGLFVYVTGSAALFMNSFHVSPQNYAIIFAVLSIGFIGGSQLNHFLARKFKSETIFQTLVLIQVTVAVLFLLGSFNAWYDLWPTMVFLFVLLTCCGLTYPNAAAVALMPFEKNAGSASALLGFLQIGLGALMSSLMGLLNTNSNLSIAFVMCLSSILGVIVLFAGKQKIKQAPES